MRYLLVNHVPVARGSNDHRVRVGDLFLEDLRAQARALQSVGGRLTVATPLVDEMSAVDGGSFNTVEVTPADEGFEHFPIPRFLSMRQYLRSRREFARRVTQAVRDCDIVQVDYGGHPYMLGELVLPVARREKRKCIWVFDGGDPFGNVEFNVRNTANPIRRALRGCMYRRMLRACREAVRSSDLVFAHNASVVERFADVWDARCHQFSRSFVTDATLLTADEVNMRKRLLRDPSAPFRIVAAGRQIAIKGTDHVLRALQQARAQGHAIEFHVIGDGEQLPQFKHLAGELGLTGAVHFERSLPFGKPLFDRWATMHAMVLTNLTTELSRNVLLSLARGLPLITYSNPGHDSLLKSSDAAEIVPMGDVAALTSAIVRASRDRERLVQLVDNGLKVASENTLDATHRARANLAMALLRPESG